MIRPLLVLVAQSLDTLTFLLAVGMDGVAGESNPVMRAAYQTSPGLFLALKSAGAIGLASIVQLRPRYLLPAVGVGLLGAVINLAAVRIF